MFRFVRARLSLNKGAIAPGPPLCGWGRSVQRRRLQYDSTEARIRKGPSPQRSVAVDGLELRRADYQQVNTYYKSHSRFGYYLVNASLHWWLVVGPFGMVAWMAQRTCVRLRNISRDDTMR